MMKKYLVKDLMVPLNEYATVAQSATLFEAVMALEKVQADYDHTKYRHRAVLVYDEKQKIIGKLSQMDVLRALEPKYDEISGSKTLTRYGFSRKFMKSMFEQYRFFDKPMDDICRKAGQQLVSKFMSTLSEGEHVEENATLDEAIHQLVLGHHHSLVVTRGKEIVGVLRLTDVFAAVFHAMKTCYIDQNPETD
jgi:CBS domain-containing protein